jgi:mannose-6-phosphate isomerase-like protein (cupin superfamily)
MFNMKNKTVKLALYPLVGIAAYLAVGYCCHLVIFPEDKPDVGTYFQPGQVFYSKAEGFRQRVLKQEAGQVHCSLEIEPFAPGPPKHIHADFDEYFRISNGQLSVWVDGQVKQLRPGETLFIPKGTPHQPYNETAETIHCDGSFAFPEAFAFQLTQVYGAMDHTPGFGKSPATVLQMALFTTSGFDSYIAEGPPVPVQKTLIFLITPLARLLGYRSYYPQYDSRMAHLNRKVE